MVGYFAFDQAEDPRDFIYGPTRDRDRIACRTHVDYLDILAARCVTRECAGDDEPVVEAEDLYTGFKMTSAHCGAAFDDNEGRYLASACATRAGELLAGSAVGIKRIPNRDAGGRWTTLWDDDAPNKRTEPVIPAPDAGVQDAP